MLIYGKPIAHAQQMRIRASWEKLGFQKRQPKLAVIQVGDDPASSIYVRNKLKACHACGFLAQHFHLDSQSSTTYVADTIRSLNEDPNIDGIILQLPLPEHLNAKILLALISPDKDVDAITPYHLGALTSANPTLLPCTAQATMLVLDSVVPDITGMHAVVIGASTIVGKPISLQLLHANATVTICHKHTQNLARIISDADIVISACGHPGVLTARDLPSRAIVIDIGITRIDNRVVGDIYTPDVAEKVQAITPVPGGIGPVTVSCMIHNLFSLYLSHTNQICK